PNVPAAAREPVTGRTRPAGQTAYEHRQGHRPRSPGDLPPAGGPPRTAFVLADDAALGAMQAGMVHALYERAIRPDPLLGSSVRALNAAFLASRALPNRWTHASVSCACPWRCSILLAGAAPRAALV